MLASGLRRGELLGTRWDDVDLDARAVQVARQVLLRPEGRALYVRETTKSRRTRRVRIDEVTGAALRRWKAEQSAERLAFGAPWRTDGGHRLATEGAWAVTEPNGYIVEPDTLLRRWKALVRSSGVTPITLHGARHSFATLALSAGARLDVVSRQLGHASIAITADVYGHPDDEATAVAAQALGEILGK